MCSARQILCPYKFLTNTSPRQCIPTCSMADQSTRRISPPLFGLAQSRVLSRTLRYCVQQCNCFCEFPVLQSKAVFSFLFQCPLSPSAQLNFQLLFFTFYPAHLSKVFFSRADFSNQQETAFISHHGSVEFVFLLPRHLVLFTQLKIQLLLKPAGVVSSTPLFTWVQFPAGDCSYFGGLISCCVN